MSIPQGDTLAFAPTLLWVALSFLGGYYLFVTIWVPRVLLTIRARHWVLKAVGLPAGFLSTGETWPEGVLLGIQFISLALLVGTASVVSNSDEFFPCSPARVTSPGQESLSYSLLMSVHLQYREICFFRPAGVSLVTLIDRVALSFPVPLVPQVWPILSVVVRSRLMSDIRRVNRLG